MKIFQVITVSEYGGAQTIVANLIKSLSTEHEVFVLYGGEGEAWSLLGDNFTKIRLNKHRKSITLGDIGLLLKLFYYRIKYNPDIIHLHSSKMGALGRLVFSRKKTIYTVHGFDSVRRHFRKFLIVEKLLKSKVAKIIGVSKYDTDGLIEEKIDRNVTCIYNGVPDYLNTEVEYDPVFLKKLNQIKSEYPKVVMCIARISKQKRFEMFLDIAKKLPQYAFVWIGNKEEIQGLPKNTFCLGEVDAAYLYFKFADLFILPTNYEGLPMSLLEAMSFGKPIVASAVGGISEVLDYGNGFAVENDLNIFVKKIDYILSNKDVHDEMSKKSRELFLEKFTIEKMINEYLTIYKSLVKEKE